MRLVSTASVERTLDHILVGFFLCVKFCIFPRELRKNVALEKEVMVKDG